MSIHKEASFNMFAAQQVKIKGDVMEPTQHVITRNFKTATDFYTRHMLKHPFLSEFHSYSELLYAALLEGDPTVISYVPQPFHLQIGKRHYKPDVYVLREKQRRQVIELKPRGEMDETLRVPLFHYFKKHRIDFEVLSNEAVMERRTEAENWLEIIQILVEARHLTTTKEEQQVWERLFKNQGCTLREIVDSGNREGTYSLEVALFRLLHQGHVVAELSEKSLDYDTVFQCA